MSVGRQFGIKVRQDVGGQSGVSRGILARNLKWIRVKAERPPQTATLEEVEHAENAENTGQLFMWR